MESFGRKFSIQFSLLKCTFMYLFTFHGPFVFGTDVYSDTWAVHINGGPGAAKQLAEDHGYIYVNEVMRDYYLIRHKSIAKRSVQPKQEYHRMLTDDPRVNWAEQQRIKRRVKRDNVLTFNDPKWPQLWYMNRGNGLDMNVLQAYNVWKMTGKGVVVTILDDGIEKDHPDLAKNYDAGASYDVNGHDSDPQPRYDDSNENRHGTRCAGEVAAEANNGICSVGIAYEAGIGGVRMLDGDVTDAVEAQSISLNPQHIDIYSASWGPDDDGRTVDGPGPLARKAFIDGIKYGRGGLGSVYVWASGNGGQQGDGCNCDGYTNSMYTLSISSASESGKVPWYSEACSSTLAATYSSGQGSERQIITTDLRKKCTENHTGTSASAPLAAGICALTLQANPKLTWRDMQHIVVLTSKKANLKADDWTVNGANKEVSHHFGFGLMDAASMVEMASTWEAVPRQRRCTVYTSFEPRSVPPNGFIESDIATDGCLGTPSEIHYLEHVEAVISLSTSVRGRVQIYLTSPSGTKSTLLALRSRDTSSDGFNQWPFMTTHNWYEAPSGKWTLQVHNGASVAVLKNWTLVLFGTEYHPLSRSRNSTTNTRTTGLCEEGEYYLRPLCYTECPENFYPENMTASNVSVDINDTVASALCSSCHSTCARCIGPEPNQCLACHRQHVLDPPTNTCIARPSTDRAPKDSAMDYEYMLKKILLILVLSLSCLFVSALLVCVLLYAVNCNGNKISDELIERSTLKRPLLEEVEEDDEVAVEYVNRTNSNISNQNSLTSNRAISEYWLMGDTCNSVEPLSNLNES